MDRAATGCDAAFLDLVARALWEVAGRRLAHLDAQTRISELGIDSVAMLELVGTLEQALDVRLPDERTGEVRTIGELAALVADMRASRGGG